MAKARAGRGCKQDSWTTALHEALLDEFERLRKLGMKFNVRTLTMLAKNLITNSSTTELHASLTAGTQNKPIVVLVNSAWTRRFIEKHGIVLRRQTGKLMLLPEANLLIERRVAFFLGRLARDFQSGVLSDEVVENADETHFVFNQDDGKTLGFRGECDIKYADVTSGGEGMTMMVRITGGERSIIANPFIIFKNKDSKYPIRGIPDDVPGVCYRTGPKGSISKKVMLEWVKEDRILPRLPANQKRILFMDNCSSHGLTPELQAALESKRTEIRFLPANATHLLQPADSFVIQKIKEKWSERWEKHKFQKLLQIATEGTEPRNGALPNPGKIYFLKLAADAVRDVNRIRDDEGLTYARKAMIRCGFAKQANGLWEVRQLFPHLQNIIEKHRECFDGLDPDA